MELTKKGTARKRKPKQKIYYFTKDTEEAILEYIKSDNQIFRNKLYLERIDHAFFKLTQNIINTFKFPYMDGTIEDVQQECIYHILEKLHLYNQDKGSAYSYFGTCVKRYLINNNLKAYKKLINKSEVDEIDNDYNITNELEGDIEKLENNIFSTERYVIDKFIEYSEMHGGMIYKDDDERFIGGAIINIFKKLDNLEILKKKAIFIYIREQTKKDTTEITKVIKKLKKIYDRLNNQYNEFGFISLNF